MMRGGAGLAVVEPALAGEAVGYSGWSAGRGDLGQVWAKVVVEDLIFDSRPVPFLREEVTPDGHDTLLWQLVSGCDDTVVD